ncbi:Lateral flagellin [Alkalilimnicola ehrlichii]|uniref:Flagellin n=1 Tax=Alkalilimnicola ehrlichii TaxID=351052 RepID=A0A3E0WZ66_9GAMM|nr:flagellin [Alkalilimnicola ehrlichii]RFA30744.1 Lateral flagellin [Alkalilimnicola ehrlichii]RFA38320.1 Lateral flagellin [Alkalilimnicola ehrlichii]
MSLSIHTNYSALVTQTSLNRTNDALSLSQQRLGTGYRINSAADDAAGLQIAARLEAQTRGMSVASRNSQDAISLLQTAEGAMDEMSNIVLRMRDLALQAANETNGETERNALDAEYQQLIGELNNILDNTSYGANNPLFTADGVFSDDVRLQIGASAAEELTITGIDLDDIDPTALGDIGGADSTNAVAELAELDDLIDAISSARGEFGAYMNRLNHTINNLANMGNNTDAARGRIMDTDFASESAQLSKQSMLMQSGLSMLRQTSQMPNMIMTLLS